MSPRQRPEVSLATHVREAEQEAFEDKLEAARLDAIYAKEAESYSPPYSMFDDDVDFDDDFERGDPRDSVLEDDVEDHVPFWGDDWFD